MIVDSLAGSDKQIAFTASLRIREVFLVHFDNWFDYKWLGWWCGKGEEPRIPRFTPNRIRFPACLSFSHPLPIGGQGG